MISVVDSRGRLAFRREHGAATETVVMDEAASARVALILATKAEPVSQAWLEVFCSCFDLCPEMAESRTVVRHKLH